MNGGLGNAVVVHELSKWHKAQLSVSDNACVLLPLSTLVHKHGLMARSEAEGPKIKKYVFYSANSD